MVRQNNQDKRPKHEEFLENIHKEHGRKLTVFLGIVAYAMLETARDRQYEGVNIVIGYMKTHGRQETENLVSGLP